MTMKKVILSVVMIAFLGGSLFAQQNKSEKKQKADAAIEQMATELNLDESQKTLFESVIKYSMKKRKELKSENLSPEVRQQRLQAIDQSENSKMNELMTPDQYKKFIELKEEQKEATMKKKGANES